MAKTLVIKNSDFYSNRLDHVDFVSRPCTALTLSQSQATVAGSLTLVATPVPINTTDAIVWSSTDDRVATVSNGIVIGRCWERRYYSDMRELFSGLSCYSYT